MDDEILPEDNSIFLNLSNRPDDVSSDCLLEDSFSEFSNTVPTDSSNTSTPSTSRRRSARIQSPSSSPSRVTRSSTRAAAPISSPSRVTRSSARAAASSPTTVTTLSSARSGATGPTTTCSSPVRNASTRPAAVSKFKCPKCPNVLANKKNLDTHLRSHLMQGVTSRAPTYDQLLQKMPELVDATLDELEKEPVIGSLSASCNGNVKTLRDKFKEDVSGDASEMYSFLSENFSDILKGKKALFPSSIRSTMYSGTNKLLSAKDFLMSMTGFLTAMCEDEEQVVNVVIGNFIFMLSQKVLVFVIKTMQGCTVCPVVTRKKRSNDDINDIEFQQLVYHIGGSIVNGFLWKGNQYSDNSLTWASFCDVLKSRFLRSDSMLNQCSEAIRAHTDTMDRGGLKHLSDAAFDFFLFLFDFVMSLEGDDGSLPANIMDNNVLQSDVLLCLWDVLVGDCLSEIDSLDLLVQVSQSCVKVTMKGIMKRRLNEGLKKAYDSVALRARLAK